MCLTTRARGPLGRTLFGSVAHAIVRGCDEAIVLVGPSCKVAETSSVRRILVCLDGTAEAEAILSWATRWSVATKVPLVLVRVVCPLVEPAARVPPTEEQLDELGYVRGVALRLEREGCRVADVTVQHPSPPDAIVDLAADIPGALVAVSLPIADRWSRRLRAAQRAGSYASARCPSLSRGRPERSSVRASELVVGSAGVQVGIRTLCHWEMRSLKSP